jgi:diguanylate cyclase (GGDEF)-like protein
MEDIAYNDSLTGLPNRISLYLHIDKRIQEISIEAETLDFLFLDLDGFKAVNDGFGHHMGDLLLKEVGNRLENCLEEGEFIARLGGDEFVILTSSRVNEAKTKGRFMGSRIINAINMPFIVNGESIQIGCSIGWASWPEHGDDPDAVLQLADKALYYSKISGKNVISLYPS